MLRNLNGLTKEKRVLAKRKWIGEFRGARLGALDALSQEYRFSIALGDLIFLYDKWYVTNAGLLRLACRTHCGGIRVQQIREFCDSSVSRWVFKATVYKSPRSKGFVGYGDADPSNVSHLVRGAEMRVAETRAVNRALRKAYGIGLSSVEELGSNNGPPQPTFRSLFEAETVSSGNSYDPLYRIPLPRSSGAIHKLERDFSLRLLRAALASSSDRRVSEKPAGHLFSFLRDCTRRTSLGGRCYESKTNTRSIAV